NGITAQAASAGISTMAGATTYSTLCAALGKMTSLVSSFNTSAKGWNKPRGPTRLGPVRTCIQPISLRSQNVRYATHKMMGKAIQTILIRIQTTAHKDGPNKAAPWV